jgi:hypothetical protein
MLATTANSNNNSSICPPNAFWNSSIVYILPVEPNVIIIKKDYYINITLYSIEIIPVS